MGGGNLSRPGRQPAIRMFAREYFESNLLEQGDGEYAPNFVITKLGAKTNRMMVAGLLEKMERQDTDNGANYRGSIRDPTGLHMFSVAAFQPELHAEMEELLAKFEQNDEPILLLAIGKCNPFQSEDGNIFTGIRLEQFTTIDSEGNANWLVEAADATLRRIDNFQKSRDLEANVESYRAAGIPSDLIEGLIAGRAHPDYSNVDANVFMVAVMRALDRAEGNITSFSDDDVQSQDNSSDTSSDKVESSDNAKDLISNYILSKDLGDGVHHESIMKGLESNGVSRGDADTLLHELLKEEKIKETSFGYFSLVLD